MIKQFNSAKEDELINKLLRSQQQQKIQLNFEANRHKYESDSYSD